MLLFPNPSFHPPPESHPCLLSLNDSCFDNLPNHLFTQLYSKSNNLVTDQVPFISPFPHDFNYFLVTFIKLYHSLKSHTIAFPCEILKTWILAILFILQITNNLHLKKVWNLLYDYAKNFHISYVQTWEYHETFFHHVYIL